MKKIVYLCIALIATACCSQRYQFTDNVCDNLFLQIENDLIYHGYQNYEYDWFEQLADKFYCKYTKSEDKAKTLSEILSYFEKKYPEYYQCLSETGVYIEYYNKSQSE
jgi:hypothetical protein